VGGLSSLLALAPLAYAQSSPPAQVCKAPNRDRAIKLQAVLDRQMKLISATPLQGEQDLAIVKSGPESARSSAQTLKCDEPALSPKEQRSAQDFEARAVKWAVDMDARFAAEDEARSDIIIPLCTAVWTVTQMREWIAKEKSNPAGVVDLQKLHDWGATMQESQAEIDALKPRYVSFRRRAFAGWESEAACVAEANKPQDSPQ
jgi:hypothetical protein